MEVAVVRNFPLSLQPRHSTVWASLTTDARHDGLRRYIWAVHPVGAAIAFVAVLVASAGDPSPALFWIAFAFALAIGGVRFAGDAQATRNKMTLLGVIDLLAVAGIAATDVSFWIPGLFIGLAIVSIGWIESPLSSLVLVVVSAVTMSLAGMTAGVDYWWVVVAAVAVEGLMISFVAHWSASDVLLDEFTSALDSLRIIIWKADGQGTVTEAIGHADLMAVIGNDDLIGRSVTSFVEPSVADEVLREITGPGRVSSTSVVHQLDTGDTSAMARTSVRAVRTRHGFDIHGLTVDISDGWSAAESNRRQTSVVSHMRDGLIIADRPDASRELRVDQANDAALELLGLRSTPDWVSLHARYPELARQLELVIDSGKACRWDLESDGADPRWIQVQVFPLSDTAVAAQLADVTADRQQQDEARYQASHDGLTDLLNAKAFRSALTERLDPLATQESVAVFVLDLDEFKPVNDQYGHAAGDIVLTRIAQRLASCLKDGDTVARMGGDEFVGFVDGLITDESVERLVARIESTCCEPITVSDDEIVAVSGTVGWTWAHSGDDCDASIAAADRAMYRRKLRRSDRRGREHNRR